MPLGLDLTQRIVNVKWETEKGVFVAGDFAGNIFYCDPKSTKDDHTLTWIKHAPVNNFAGAVGSSYGVVGKTDQNKGKSVFVVVGNFYGDDQGISVFSSYDGSTWQETLHEPDEHPESERDWTIQRSSTGVVWDKEENAFYYVASLVRRKVITLPTLIEENETGERMYRSSDGFSWSVAAEVYIPFAPGEVDYTDWPEPSMILTHCNKPQNDDEKMPDGFYGHSKTTDTLMKPGTAMEFHTRRGAEFLPIGGDSVGAPTVKIERDTAPTIVSVSIPCNSVAYAGNVWVAGGGSTSGDFDQWYKGIDASFDQGKTWVNTLNEHTSEGPITTIIGGQVIKA